MSERNPIFNNIEEKLRAMNLQPTYGVKSPWGRCRDLLSKMTPEQANWAVSQPSVKEAERQMREAFEAFLFENKKEEFALFGSGCYVPVINNYIDSLANVSREYTSHTQELEQKAARTDELERKLAELQSQIERQNEKNIRKI